MDTELLKLLVPIGTFILGSLFTLWTNAIEQPRSALQSAARVTVKLTKDWYNQVLCLSASVQNCDDRQVNNGSRRGRHWGL